MPIFRVVGACSQMLRYLASGRLASLSLSLPLADHAYISEIRRKNARLSQSQNWRCSTRAYITAAKTASASYKVIAISPQLVSPLGDRPSDRVACARPADSSSSFLSLDCCCCCSCCCWLLCGRDCDHLSIMLRGSRPTTATITASETDRRIPNCLIFLFRPLEELSPLLSRATSRENSTTMRIRANRALRLMMIYPTSMV